MSRIFEGRSLLSKYGNELFWGDNSYSLEGYVNSTTEPFLWWNVIIAIISIGGVFVGGGVW